MGSSATVSRSAMKKPIPVRAKAIPVNPWISSAMKKDDACVGCLEDGDCDDGLYCTGDETCVSGECESSGDPCTDDGVSCTGTEICDEETDACMSSGDPCSDDGALL